MFSDFFRVNEYVLFNYFIMSTHTFFIRTIFLILLYISNIYSTTCIHVFTFVDFMYNFPSFLIFISVTQKSLNSKFFFHLFNIHFFIHGFECLFRLFTSSVFSCIISMCTISHPCSYIFYFCQILFSYSIFHSSPRSLRQTFPARNSCKKKNVLTNANPVIARCVNL